MNAPYLVPVRAPPVGGVAGEGPVLSGSGHEDVRIVVPRKLGFRAVLSWTLCNCRERPKVPRHSCCFRVTTFAWFMDVAVSTASTLDAMRHVV